MNIFFSGKSTSTTKFKAGKSQKSTGGNFCLGFKWWLIKDGEYWLWHLQNPTTINTLPYQVNYQLPIQFHCRKIIAVARLEMKDRNLLKNLFVSWEKLGTTSTWRCYEMLKENKKTNFPSRNRIGKWSFWIKRFKTQILIQFPSGKKKP